jgi:hypothetical protein
VSWIESLTIRTKVDINLGKKLNKIEKYKAQIKYNLGITKWYYRFLISSKKWPRGA